ncbi:MAG: DNA replication and repair protein RecF [Bacteroidetes bacterium]|nr:DNA replication and repair protein RecF [Bacteroidota bacterium]
MHLSWLIAENFKNSEKLDLKFVNKFNCFTGKNGAGKTNILDAIYYLACGKSWFNAQDSQLIHNGENYFSILGSFNKDGKEDEIRAVQMQGRRKVIKRNDVAYERLIDHYGNYPVVMIAPGDLELVYGISEDRRRWMDSIICAVEKDYMLALIKYEKLLQQRNAQLKKMALENTKNKKLVEVYNEMLEPVVQLIHQQRVAFAKEFLPYFQKYYSLISNRTETPEVEYQSQLNDAAYEDLLQRNFEQDFATQRTNVGTHKDDLEFKIQGQALKKFGSQGQQKTFLFALKLGQYSFMLARKGTPPILLLDDVCERLDDERLAQLMELLTQEEFGQIFITDTSKERLKKLLPKNGDKKFYHVQNGMVKEEK